MVKLLTILGSVGLFIFLILSSSSAFAATTQRMQVTLPLIGVPSPLQAHQQQKDMEMLFRNRPIFSINPLNFIAYGVRQTLVSGVPLDTLVLILAIPIIATLVVFFRYIVGLPTLGIAPTIVLAITFFATGLIFGTILFVTLLAGTIISRAIFKRLRIMQLTKVALSMLVVSVLILIALVSSLHYGFITSGQISIFPVLLFILLSERIVALQLEKNIKESIAITFMTLILGGAGFSIISLASVRNVLLLYPELLLLLLPINWFIGRYFGLRLTEYFRFVPNIHPHHGNK